MTEQKKPNSRLFALLAEMPSTNTRIALTLLMALGTGVKYWASNTWEPSVPWLAFLVTLGGLDVIQFHSKRTTYREDTHDRS